MHPFTRALIKIGLSLSFGFWKISINEKLEEEISSLLKKKKSSGFSFSNFNAFKSLALNSFCISFFSNSNFIEGNLSSLKLRKSSFQNVKFPSNKF